MADGSPSDAPPLPSPTIPPYDRRWLAVLFLTPLLLWGCYSTPFFELDDVPFIRDNPALQDSAPWSAVFSRDIDPLYIPLNYLSLRLDRVLVAPAFRPSFGDNAWPVATRTVNLLLHVGVALLVWWLLRGLGVNSSVAGFAVAAVALHPAVCHAVCWPIERKSILAGFFGFAAIGVYMRGSSPKHIFGAALLHLCALMSKPSAFGLIPIVVVWELLGRPRLCATDNTVRVTTQYGSRKEVLLKLTPWVITVALALWNQMLVLSPLAMPRIGGSVFTVILTDLPVLQRYLTNYLCITPVSADYGMAGVFSLADPRLWIAVAFLAVLIGGTLALARVKARRIVLFAWLWFFGALTPALNFVGKNNLMEDCYAYLSAPAFWLALGLALEGAGARLKSVHLARFVPAAVGLLAIAFALSSAKRSYLFSSTEALYADAVDKEPEGSLNHLVLGQLLRRRADAAMLAGDTAEEKQLRARELHELEAGVAGNNFDRSRLVTSGHVWLARSYYEHGRTADALVQIEHARHSPQGVDREHGATLMRLLGLIAYDAGNDEQAIKYFDGALSLMPTQTFIWIDRVKALLRLRAKYVQAGNKEGADNCDAGLKQALELKDDAVRAEIRQLLNAKQ